MDAMVKALYEKETIYEDEIDALFGEENSDSDSIFSSKINRAAEPVGETATTTEEPVKSARKKKAEMPKSTENEVNPEQNEDKTHVSDETDSAITSEDEE